MENLKMHTPDLADKNFKKLAALFPNAVTEVLSTMGAWQKCMNMLLCIQKMNYMSKHSC